MIDYSNVKRKGWQVLQFPEKPLKCIRVYGRKNLANKYFHVVELEAYRRDWPDEFVPKLVPSPVPQGAL